MPVPRRITSPPAPATPSYRWPRGTSWLLGYAFASNSDGMTGGLLLRALETPFIFERHESGSPPHPRESISTYMCQLGGIEVAQIERQSH